MPVGWRDQIIRVLHSRSGGSTNRAHNVAFLAKKEIDISSLKLEETASRANKRSMEVRLEGKAEEIGTLDPIHDRVCWQGNRTLVHWGLYPMSKGRESWDMSGDLY